MKKSNIISKYLKKQNHLNWKINLYENELFSNIIVIPVIEEFDNMRGLINSLYANKFEKINKTLVLFVINNKKSSSNKIKNNNFESINFIKNLIEINDSFLKFGFIDCGSAGKELPEKDGGVGLARKIGMDLALSHFDYESKTPNILISLDADCLISENYLHEITSKFNEPNVKAAVINFEHQPAENIEQNLAIINYEMFLRYYLLGLKISKSPYAFHTIGSAFAVEAETYVKIGGMNKKQAGEDFYFLQKLAKNTQIHKVVDATVFPSARISNRVPFGTGPRIKRFLENPHNEYLVYSPKIFQVLKNWLEILKNSMTNIGGSVATIENDLNQILEKAKNIHPELYNFLIKQNFNNNWLRILQNSKSITQINKQKLMWMDGFRTLKLIHHLRDNAFQNENMFESINRLFEEINEQNIYNIKSEIPNLEIQMKFLNKLRTLT